MRRRGQVRERLQRCLQCKKEYPELCFAVNVCAICALYNRNRMHGLPEGTPFQGENAAQMHADAVAYDKRRANA